MTRPSWTHRSTLLGICALATLTSGGPALSAQTMTLREAIDDAIASHPTLRGSAAREESARQSLSAVQSTRWPMIGMDMSLTQFEEPMLAQPIHSFDPTNLPRFDETLLQGRLGVQYNLFGGRASRISAATAGLETVRSRGRAEEQALIEAVASAFIRVLSSRALLEAADAQVSAFEEERSRAQVRFDAGTVPRVEVLRAAVAYQDAVARRSDLRVGTTFAERGLARLIGRPAASISSAEMLPVVFRDEPLSGSADANPGVAAARGAAEVARARLRERRSEKTPSVDLTAGVVDFSTGGTHVLEWQAGVQLSWMIFSGGRRRASERGAQAELAAAEGDVEATLLQVDDAIDAAMTSIEAATARIEALSQSVAQWDELARIEALALETGTGVQADLLRAEAGRFSARAGLANARHDAALARIRLARAQGALTRDWIDGALEVSP